MRLLAVVAVVVALLCLGAAKCSDHTQDGCGGCTSERWLGGHCGWCWDGGADKCRDGFSSGPLEGDCQRWEYYGSGGAPNKQCCGDVSSCFSCTGPQCTWCTTGVCLHKDTAPGYNCTAATSCCSARTDCASCASSAGCSWCLSSNSCTPSAQCSTPDPHCCSLYKDCQSCQVQSNNLCSFCRFNNQCIDATGICLAFADANCCDAMPDMTCATCVAANPKCAYCADAKVCSNSCSSAVALNVTPTWGWMCNDPLLLNCEAQGQCGDCVAASGCVWVPDARVNGAAVGGLCFTGGLFSLDNANQPGFRLDAPAGWYFGTCSITVLSIIIIAASALGVLLLVIVTGIAVCVYLRRRRSRRLVAEYSQLRTDPDPLANGPYVTSAGPPVESAAPQRKKKKKQRPAAAVTNTSGVADNASINASRYSQARDRVRQSGY